MKRKFLINIVFLLAISIVVKAFWVLGIDRSVQNIAGEEAYGFYFSLFSFSVLFTLILDMGLSGFNNRAVSADPSRVRLYFGNVLLLRLGLTVAYFVITVSIAWALGYSSRQFNMLLVLMLNQVLASFILWLRSNISGMQYFILDSILSVSDRLIMIIICSFLLWSGVVKSSFRIEWFVWAQTVSYMIVFIIALLIVIRRGGVPGVKPEARVLKGIIFSGLPYALVAFSMTMYWRSDTVIIERLLPDGTAQAGNYAQAFRLFDAVAMIPVMFGGLLLPIFSREHTRGTNIAPLVSLALPMLLVPLGIAATVVATSPREILDLLYTSPAESSVNTFRILMLTLIPVGAVYIFTTILTACGKIKALGVVTAIAVAVNLILNSVLIPEYKGAGAATAALVTQSLVAVISIILVKKYMHIGLSVKRSTAFVSMLSVIAATGLILRYLELSWVLVSAIQLAFGTGWALIFRLIEPVKSLKLIAEKQ